MGHPSNLGITGYLTWANEGLKWTNPYSDPCVEFCSKSIDFEITSKYYYFVVVRLKQIGIDKTILLTK
jgi:hypothetical protein